jgi:hypothetical protein
LQGVSKVKSPDKSPSSAPTIEDESIQVVADNFTTAGDQQSNLPTLTVLNEIPRGLSSEHIQQEVVIPVSPTSVSVDAKYKSEKSGFVPHQPPNQLHALDPESWTVRDVGDWLYYKDIPDYIIEIFKKERINGQSLFLLSLDSVGAMGVTAFGERLVLTKLITNLKDEWMWKKHGMGSGVVGIRMEDGKGAPATNAPPSYSAE